MRRCDYCGGELPTRARRDRRTCSTRCRVALHRANSLPTELTSRARWVRHDRKRPITVHGAPASTTDPATWSTYAQAKRSRVGDGLGYVLVAGDGVVCLDLDHVLDGGELVPEAEALLDRLPATYVEVSPSGTGLHVWGRGDLVIGRRTVVDGVRLEAYGDRRFITVTGRRWRGAPCRLADLEIRSAQTPGFSRGVSASTPLEQ